MLHDLGYLERRMGQDLGLRLVVNCTKADHPGPTPIPDCAQARDVASPRRRGEWRAGRAALRLVMGRIGLAEDPTSLAFPHPRVSLTHSRGVAVAVGARRPELTGIGVDLQVGHAPSPAALRFFLTGLEQSWVTSRGAAADEAALRLWTVKEAVFKSDPANGGHILYDYTVCAPDRWVGSARRGTEVFQYTTMAVDTGFLTVAIRKESNR